MKILYVEDNPANVFLVKRVARMGQHEIINYIDGDQAIQKFNEVNPDLVLMDIQLAGDKSGLDVVKELRKLGVKTAIIAVTAYAMVGDKERCIAAGCTDYLAKPLPIPRLVEIFKHYSDIAEAKSAATKPVEDPIPETETVESKLATPKENVSAEVTTIEDPSKTTTVIEKDTTPQDKAPNTETTVEKDTTTNSTLDDNSSQNTASSNTIEEPVAPANVSTTIDSKEGASTGESL